MKTKEQINELKDGRTLKQIKSEDPKTYYKIQSLSEKLSVENAYEKGQFITREHLTEYKPLIIWLLKNKVDFGECLDMRQTMIDMLNKVESTKIIYKSEKGIKGIVCDLAIRCGLANVENNLRERNGMTIHTSEMNTPLLESFNLHRLNVLMGR